MYVITKTGKAPARVTRSKHIFIANSAYNSKELETKIEREERQQKQI